MTTFGPCFCMSVMRNLSIDRANPFAFSSVLDDLTLMKSVLKFDVMWITFFWRRREMSQIHPFVLRRASLCSNSLVMPKKLANHIFRIPVRHRPFPAHAVPSLESTRSSITSVPLRNGFSRGVTHIISCFGQEEVTNQEGFWSGIIVVES